MATRTLGTNLTTSLTAVLFSSGSDLADADIATITNSILFDNAADAIYPGAFARNGLLYVPNRGVLRVLAGDFVGVDAAGWPILVSADAIADAGGSWTHT